MLGWLSGTPSRPAVRFRVGVTIAVLLAAVVAASPQGRGMLWSVWDPTENESSILQQLQEIFQDRSWYASVNTGAQLVSLAECGPTQVQLRSRLQDVLQFLKSRSVHRLLDSHGLGGDLESTVDAIEVCLSGWTSAAPEAQVLAAFQAMSRQASRLQQEIAAL